jgi:hypothetical protein
MAQHDPVKVLLIVLMAAVAANWAVLFEMKRDVKRAVPDEEIPTATFRGDWRPQRWLLRRHRELYPGDILAPVASGLNLVGIVVIVILLLAVFSRAHLRQ